MRLTLSRNSWRQLLSMLWLIEGQKLQQLLKIIGDESIRQQDVMYQSSHGIKSIDILIIMTNYIYNSFHFMYEMLLSNSFPLALNLFLFYLVYFNLFNQFYMIAAPSHPPSRPSTQGSLLQIQKISPFPTFHQSKAYSSIHSLPAENYIISINLQSINTKTYQKDKIKQQYLNHFQNKLGMRNKSRVLPGSEDYLYKLTTKEIDNLIRMERNRYLGSEQEIEVQRIKPPRKGSKIDRYTYVDQHDQNKSKQKHKDQNSQRNHCRIYRPSFLSKLNKIVKKTNFLNKTDNLISYHYKQPPIRKNSKYVSGDTMPESQCFQHDNLDTFSIIGKGIKESRPTSEMKDHKEYRDKKRQTWFSGMSRSLINKFQEKQEPVFRGMNLERKMDNRLKTSYY